jgi:hypothetical protein
LRGALFTRRGWLAECWVEFGADDADAALGQELEAHVGAAFGPLVALLGKNGADQPDDGVAAREAAACTAETPRARLRIGRVTAEASSGPMTRVVREWQ